MSLLGYIIANIVIYMPFHLFEEALGDFPKWMYEHKWLPHHMNHGHWMANNIFVYYPLLLISFFLYYFFNMTALGVAILIWGVINFGDHFFYTIKDKKVSPGLFTGIIFLINSVLGLINFVHSDLFSILTVIEACIVGGVLFGAPIGLCILLYNSFEKFIR